MLAITKQVLGNYFCFATVRAASKKSASSAPSQEGELGDKDAFKAYRRQVQKSSILRQFREDVFRRAQLVQDWNSPKSSQKQSRKLKQMLNVDREQMLKNVSNIEARAAQSRTIFDQNSDRSLLSDYGNYKSYDKVYPVIDDRNLGEFQYLEDSQLTKNLYEFIDKLPDEYQEKREIQAGINSLPVAQQKMTIAEYGRKLQKDINDAQRNRWKLYEDFKIHEDYKYPKNDKIIDPNDIDTDWFAREPEQAHEFTGIPKATDPYKGGDGFDATLSPKAVDNIYELYLQGWTIRDISKRYGIMPARTKFCIWVRAQLYHEIIPKLGVNFYLRALRFEQRYNEGKTFCDYGLDIQELSNEGVLESITEWNAKMLDAQRKEDKYQGAMTRLSKEKKFNKYEMVEVGTVGKENHKYRLKQWHIFRGKGSDDYFLKHKLLQNLTRAQKKFNKAYY